MMAVADIYHNQDAAARITSSHFKYLLGQMRGVGVPGMAHLVSGQACDHVVKFIGNMMSPAFIDGGRTRRGMLQESQAFPQQRDNTAAPIQCSWFLQRLRLSDRDNDDIGL